MPDEFIDTFRERPIRGKIRSSRVVLKSGDREIMSSDIPLPSSSRSNPISWYPLAMKVCWGPFLRQAQRHGGWEVAGTRLNGSTDVEDAKKVGRITKHTSQGTVERDQPDDVNTNVLEIDIRCTKAGLTATFVITVKTEQYGTMWARKHPEYYKERNLFYTKPDKNKKDED